MPKIGFLPMSLRMLPTCGDERLRIAGAVREEDAVGLEREHVFGGGERGHDGDAAADLHQAAQDVVLDAEIVGHHVVARLGAARRPGRRASRLHGLGPLVALRRWRRGWPDRARPWWECCAPFRPASAASRFDGGEHAAHDAAGAQVADQRARVEIADDGDAGVGRGRRRPRRRERQLLAMGENSRTTRPSMYGPRGFVVVGAGAVVADLRIGEDDDLAGIGRIGEDFLIAGEGGIEDDFAGPLGGRTKTPALEDGAVFQGEDCRVQFRLFLPGSG